jgi:hypothetical protein
MGPEGMGLFLHRNTIYPYFAIHTICRINEQWCWGAAAQQSDQLTQKHVLQGEFAHIQNRGYTLSCVLRFDNIRAWCPRAQAPRGEPDKTIYIKLRSCIRQW